MLQSGQQFYYRKKNFSRTWLILNLPNPVEAARIDLDFHTRLLQFVLVLFYK